MTDRELLEDIQRRLDEMDRRQTEVLRDIVTRLRHIHNELLWQRVATTEARVERLEQDRIEAAYPDN